MILLLQPHEEPRRQLLASFFLEFTAGWPHRVGPRSVNTFRNAINTRYRLADDFSCLHVTLIPSLLVGGKLEMSTQCLAFQSNHRKGVFVDMVKRMEKCHHRRQLPSDVTGYGQTAGPHPRGRIETIMTIR